MADIKRLGEISLPKLSDKVAPEDRRAINNYLMQLQDQMLYMMQNLDETNFSDSMAALENTTEALSTPGLSATMETFDGHIRVYAKNRPAVDINIVVVLLAKHEVN